MSFETLPSELKTMILCHFSTDELLEIIVPVSKQWKKFALQPILWRTVTFGGKKSKNRNIIVNLNHSVLARRIYFDGVTGLYLLPKSLNINTNIRKMKFSYCSIESDDLSVLVNHCPNVESFCLDNAGIDTEFYNVDHLHTVDLEMIETITNWQKLKSFKISGTDCDFSHNDCLLTLVDRCKSIEKIYLEELINITEKSFNVLIITRGPQLKGLGFFIPYLSNSSFKLLQKCVSLEKLELKGPKITGVDFMALAKLQHLKLLKCYNCGLFRNEYFGGCDEYFGGCEFTFNRMEEVYFTFFYWPLDIIKKHFPSLKTINYMSIEKYTELRSEDS